MTTPEMTFPSTVIDALAAEASAVRVITDLEQHGVRVLLLKGPSIERWIYDEDEVRPGGDVDLLVGPADLELAERRLELLGYVNKYDGPSPKWAEEHADVWSSGAGWIPVDLHRRLWGVRAAPRDAWECLWAGREPLELSGTTVHVLGGPARALMIALHAAHHGADFARPVADLNRAIDRLDADVWRDARSLAFELDVVAGLSAGLAIVPNGSRLRDRLGLEPADRGVVIQVASMWSAPATAAGFLRLMDERSLRKRAGILRRELFPSRRFMRSYHRGRTRTLEGAYPQRWRSLLLSAPQGLRAARAIRRARGQRDSSL